MRNATEFSRKITSRVRDEDVTFLAAAIAYYSFVSILPALLLILVSGSVFGGEELAEEILELTRDLLPENARGVLFDALTRREQRTQATVLGIVILVWSTLRVFRGLDIAFSRIHGADKAEGFIERVRDALIVLTSVGLGIVSMGVVGGFVIAFSGPLIEIASFLLLVVTLVLSFIPVYYVFPDVRMRLRDAVPGAVFAGVGWTILNAIFQVYASLLGGYSVYGVLGTVLLLVTWFYVAGLLLLMGGVVNATLLEKTSL